MQIDHDPNLPITAELPVVRTRSPMRGVAKPIGVLLIIVCAVIIGVVTFPPNNGNDLPAPDDSAAENTVPPTADGPEPTVAEPEVVEPEVVELEVVELDDVPEGFLVVSGVSSQLNVRAEAGTSSAIIATLPQGERVFATGHRVTVNGSEWKRIQLDDDRFGWVSGNYLVADTGQSTGVVKADVCLQGAAAGVTRTIRVDFLDGDAIGGVIRIDNSSGVARGRFSGNLVGGVANVVITDTGTNRDRQEKWTFRPADVVLADSVIVAVVPCESVASLLS